VTQRAEPRDYIDIHTLLTAANIPLADMLAAARVIYGNEFRPLLSLKALAYHGEPALAALPGNIRKDLIAAVAAVDPAHLPALAPIRQRPQEP
jgi:hypothetical protein